MKIVMEDVISKLILPLWNKKSIDLIELYLDRNVRIQTTCTSGIGREVLKKKVQNFFKAFSDFSIDVTDVIYHDNEVIYRWTGQAVHVNSFLQMEPTRLKITFSGIGSSTIEQGTITHFTTFSNLPSILIQQSKTPPFKQNKTSFKLDYTGIMSTIESSTGQKLTKREVECLSLWVRGTSIKETAKSLGGLSARTIQTFRENIKRKLKTNTYQKLLELVQKMGLMPIFLSTQDPMLMLSE